MFITILAKNILLINLVQSTLTATKNNQNILHNAKSCRRLKLSDCDDTGETQSIQNGNQKRLKLVVRRTSKPRPPYECRSQEKNKSEQLTERNDSSFQRAQDPVSDEEEKENIIDGGNNFLDYDGSNEDSEGDDKQDVEGWWNNKVKPSTLEDGKEVPTLQDIWNKVFADQSMKGQEQHSSSEESH